MKSVADDPGWRVMKKGNGSSWNADTTSVSEAVRRRPPPLARMLRWKTCGKSIGLTKKTKLEEDCPPDGGVTGFTVNESVTP